MSHFGGGKDLPITKTIFRPATGIYEKTGFLTGSDYVLKGWMPVPLPYKFEHETMSVVDISRRIRRDMEELVARVYPTHQKDWIRKYAPHKVDWIEMAADPLPKQAAEDASKSAKALAFHIKQGATWLEYLFVCRNALIREVAANNDLWPVNIGVKRRKINGAGRCELTRVDFARDYLMELGLNTSCNWPSHHCTGAESGKSPYWFAARELYTTLLMIKHEPTDYIRRPTRWSRSLAALEERMTKSNFPKWWKVAKVFLDEEWKLNRQFFKPLVEHLKIKPGYSSEVKTRVIDQSLKKAFEAAARNSDL